MLGVLTTVGLSIMNRSTTEVGKSTVQEESAKALEAAEVGLEKFLGGVAPAPGTMTEVVAGGAKYSLGNTQSIGMAPGYKIPFPLSDGDVGTLDFVGPPSYTGTGVTVCWGKSDVPYPTAETPAMVATIYYQVGSEVRVKSRGYDPLQPGTVRVSGWRPASGASTCGLQTNFSHTKQIRFNVNGADDLFIDGGTPLFLRTRLVYNRTVAHPVGFTSSGGASFPLQGGSVESVGSAGDAVQRIRASVPEFDLPSAFDGAVFSGTSLTKIP